AGSRYILGNEGTVGIGGQSIDKNVATAGLIGVSALVAQIGKDYVIPKLPTSMITNNMAKKAVGPVLCGGATMALQRVLVTEGDTNIASLLTGQANSTSMIGNGMVGAGSYIAADYVYNMYKK